MEHLLNNCATIITLVWDLNTDRVTPVESHCFFCILSNIGEEGDGLDWILHILIVKRLVPVCSCANSSNPDGAAQICHIITEVVDRKEDHRSVTISQSNRQRKIRELKPGQEKQSSYVYEHLEMLVAHWPEAIALAFTFNKVCLYEQPVNVSLLFPH